MEIIEKHVTDTWEESFKNVTVENLKTLTEQITIEVPKAKKINNICSKFNILCTIYAKMLHFKEDLVQYLNGTKKLSALGNRRPKRQQIATDDESSVS